MIVSLAHISNFRVLTDAQSSGIVSRLVKYYDQSQNDTEKSRIVYNKVGDFPLVQLKKNEIKRSFSKATSVRIAPPNRTVMNRDLRAAIMRSNSFQFGSGIPKVQPVKMRAKDDSHQIITNHEPLNEEAYPVSSNSVLDALEKNCRKRINNEELILDRSKKFCSPIATPSFDYSETSNNVQQTSVTTQSAKRIREPSSPNRKGLSFDFQQRAKKLRTRNNALLCSLSSSHHELIPSTPPSSPQINKTKEIPKSLLNTSPVAVKPQVSKEKEKTPIEENKEESETIDAPQEQPKIHSDGAKKLQLFNRKPDENAAINRAKFRLYDSDDDDEDEVHIKFVKPKEQVIEGNDDKKALEKAKLARMLDGLTKGTEMPFKQKDKPKDTVDAVKPVEETPKASISFSTSTTTAIVAPISSSGSTTIASSNAVQSGGFQMPIMAVSASKPDEKKTEAAPAIQLPVSSAKIPPLSSIITSSTESVKEKVQAEQTTQTTASQGIQFSFGTSGSIPLLQTKPLISFGNLPAKENDKPTLPVIGITATTKENPLASIGGFQFGQPVQTTTTDQSKGLLTVSTSSAQPITKPVSPLALFSTSAVTTQSIGISSKVDTVTTTASGVGFSFGGPKTTISGITPLPLSPPGLITPSASFNFGSKPAVPTTSPPSFNFGSNASVTTTAQQQIQSDSKPSFSFGGNSIAPTQSFSKPEAPKGSFSFGNSAQPSSSTPIFGQLSSSSSTSATTTTASGFNFGGNSNPVATQAPSFVQTTPSFASLSAPKTTTSSGSIFGNVNAMATSTQPSSVFGGFNANPTTTSATPFSTSTPSFGQSNANDPPKASFSFGSNNNVAPVPAVSSSSIFGSSTSTQAAAEPKPSFNFGNTLSAQASFGGINSAPVFGSTQSPFGSQSQENQKPAFNFNNPNSSFSFNKPQEAPSPFGNMQQQQQPENKGGFNFSQSAPQLPQLSQAQNAQGGLFNIGTAGSQQRKPFRTATRRLK